MKVNYLKIRADFKYAAKGRFYRVFLIRENTNLGELGEFMVDILGGAFEHYFLFKSKDLSFVPSTWVDDWNCFRICATSFKDKTIEDLGDNFMFLYDTGDGWDFNCKVYKRKITKEVDEDGIPFGFVLDAKGMGIWEDNIGSLYSYLNGEISKDYNQEDEERGIYKPWNYDIDKYSEFDDPVDIEDLNDIAMYFVPIYEEMY